LRRRCPEIHIRVKCRTREIPIYLVEKFVRIPGRCIGALLFRAKKFALNGFFVPFVDIVLIPFHLDVPGAGYTCDTRRIEIAPRMCFEHEVLPQPACLILALNRWSEKKSTHKSSSQVGVSMMLAKQMEHIQCSISPGSRSGSTFRKQVRWYPDLHSVHRMTCLQPAHQSFGGGSSGTGAPSFAGGGDSFIGKGADEYEPRAGSGGGGVSSSVGFGDGGQRAEMIARASS
jgi:hypothetical protein